jgi:hypothetical protein
MFPSNTGVSPTIEQLIKQSKAIDLKQHTDITLKCSVNSDDAVNRTSAELAGSETVCWCILRNTARSITNGALVDFNVMHSIRGNFVAVGDAKAPVSRQFMHVNPLGGPTSDGRIAPDFPNNVITMAQQDGLVAPPLEKAIGTLQEADGSSSVHDITSAIKPSSLVNIAKNFVPGGSFIPDWVVESALDHFQAFADELPS